MSIFLKSVFISCLVYSLVCVSESYEPKDEGSSCQLLGYQGICEKVKNCPTAMDALKNKGRHELKTCGFQGLQEIVCCPDLTYRNPVIETTTVGEYIFSGDGGNIPNRDNVGDKKERKCEKMCKKIYKDYGIKPEIEFHIINGENAKDGQFPHAVALGFQTDDDSAEIQWLCGASLISPRFLLTAAHCFVCNGCSDPKKARMGVIDITNAQVAQDVDVKNAMTHPDYNPLSKHNDIGIVELVQDVRISKTLYPACLYTGSDDPLGLQILGWGQTVSTDTNSRSSILQYAVIQPVPINECNTTVTSLSKFSSKIILETQICATTKSDACPGDSGGPLQIQKKEGGYAVVGVVSYGVQCGTKVPGIYTRVAKYLDWIEQNVWPD